MCTAEWQMQIILNWSSKFDKELSAILIIWLFQSSEWTIILTMWFRFFAFYANSKIWNNLLLLRWNLPGTYRISRCSSLLPRNLSLLLLLLHLVSQKNKQVKVSAQSVSNRLIKKFATGSDICLKIFMLFLFSVLSPVPPLPLLPSQTHYTPPTRILQPERSSPRIIWWPSARLSHTSQKALGLDVYLSALRLPPLSQTPLRMQNISAIISVTISAGAAEL